MAHSMILPQDKDDDDDAVFRSRTGSKDKADGRGAHSVFSFLTATARANDRFDVFDDDIDEEDVYEDEGDDEDDATETFSGDEDGTRHRKSTQSAESAESNESTDSTREDSHLLRSNISANHDYDDTDEIVPLEQSHSHLATSVHSMVMSKQALGSKSKGTEPEAHTRQIHHRAQESRAHALTDKLRKQLGISEDDALIGGRFFGLGIQSLWCYVMLICRLSVLVTQKYSTPRSPIFDYPTHVFFRLLATRQFYNDQNWIIEQEISENTSILPVLVCSSQRFFLLLYQCYRPVFPSGHY
jgi:hypothetical protein